MNDFIKKISELSIRSKTIVLLIVLLFLILINYIIYNNKNITYTTGINFKNNSIEKSMENYVITTDRDAFLTIFKIMDEINYNVNSMSDCDKYYDEVLNADFKKAIRKKTFENRFFTILSKIYTSNFQKISSILEANIDYTLYSNTKFKNVYILEIYLNESSIFYIGFYLNEDNMSYEIFYVSEV